WRLTRPRMRPPVGSPEAKVKARAKARDWGLWAKDAHQPGTIGRSSSVFSRGRMCWHSTQPRRTRPRSPCMAKTFRFLKQLWVETEGASLVEYAFLLALIALVSISALSILGQTISS